MIKVHVDFIRDFSIDEMRKLRAMLDTHKCLLMEDRYVSCVALHNSLSKIAVQ